MWALAAVISMNSRQGDWTVSLMVSSGAVLVVIRVTVLAMMHQQSTSYGEILCDVLPVLRNSALMFETVLLDSESCRTVSSVPRNCQNGVHGHWELPKLNF